MSDFNWVGTIRHTPSLYRGVRSPQAAFFHETVHVVRKQANFQRGLEVGSAYESEDEVYAVLVENYYRQEAGLRLRRDHRDLIGTSVQPDTAWLNGRPDGITPYRRFVERFIGAHSRIAEGLSNLAVSWNPFRRVMRP